MNRILIAVDNSAAAARKGFELARLLDAAVTLIAVSVPGEADDARQALAYALAEAERLGLDPDIEDPWGDPATQILCAARLHDADLIVVGRSRVGRVSDVVARHSRIPVLVVDQGAPVVRSAQARALQVR
jgi:nucleotide-binding universal stress UspA family protein